MLQKAISDCIFLILIMACYLFINDNLLVLNFISFDNSIINDYFAFFIRSILCFFSAIYFLFIADFLKEQKLTSIEYLIIILIAIIGFLLINCCNDLLTSYLCIELASFSCYLLAVFKKSSSYSVDGGIKYFVIGSVSSVFFLFGSSLMCDISLHLFCTVYSQYT
jgi:NADH-quinone oxidoreductase subunit N